MALWKSPLENLVNMNQQKYLERIYKGKRVFITGHTGFKGAWLLLWLHSLGAEVKGYALAPQSNEDLYNLIGGDSLCTSVIADLRDKELLASELQSFAPDFVFHLAAQPLVRLSYQLPIDTIETNVTGTANLLEAVRRFPHPCNVVVITTDKVYQNMEKEYHYKEDDKLGGYDPYSASKAAAEIIVQSYRDSFFNKKDYATHRKGIAVARAGNVIGGGDRAQDRIIPDIIRALERGESIKVRNPDAVRPWQHVLEPLFGYLLLGGRLMEDPERYAEAWNFGPENNDILQVRNLVKIALECWGGGCFDTPVEAGAPHEAGLLMLDISKAKAQLQWIPKFHSAKAIEETMKWYTSAGPDYRSYTLAQIQNYLNDGI